MTAVLIDSNVLLDLMTEDPEWFAWSAAAVERPANRSRLVINAIVYAEISVRYSATWITRVAGSGLRSLRPIEITGFQYHCQRSQAITISSTGYQIAS